MKTDLKSFCQCETSDEAFPYTIIYMREVGALYWLTETIDIRNVYAVDITREQDEKGTYYHVLLYLRDGYTARRVRATGITFEPRTYEYEFESPKKVDIMLGGDKDTADKVKRGIIMLGSLYSIKIKDGLF